MYIVSKDRVWSQVQMLYHWPTLYIEQLAEVFGSFGFSQRRANKPKPSKLESCQRLSFSGSSAVDQSYATSRPSSQTASSRQVAPHAEVKLVDVEHLRRPIRLLTSERLSANHQILIQSCPNQPFGAMTSNRVHCRISQHRCNAICVFLKKIRSYES